MVAPGFDCAMQERAAAVQAYLGTRPGTVGVVLRDRRTGAVWRNEFAAHPVWTASTVKLAIAVDLLVRDRAGQLRLRTADRALIAAMLRGSDDAATDTLWARYGRTGIAARFGEYGLVGAVFVPGFERYWGFMKCTPDALDGLIRYVLERLPPELRADLVGQLRGVTANQHWGVWAAGPQAQPGNKNGWSSEQGGWVVNTVGFAGPGERYTLSVMNSLDGAGGYVEGTATVSRVAELLFAGLF